MYSIGVLIVILGIWLYYKYAFSYWKKRGVPCMEPTIPFGHIQAVITSKKYVGLHLKDAYSYLKCQGHKHAGIYLFFSPRYFPIDINLIKHILHIDFQYFKDRGFYYNEKDDPLSANLFSLGGDRWKHLRTKLSPAFTTGKLKIMFDTVLQCGCELKDAVETIFNNKQILDAKELAISYSVNVIGSCAFGVDCNCFKNPNSDFLKFGKKTFDYKSWFRRIKMAFAFLLPNLAIWLGVEAFGKDYTHFFTNIVKETIEFRERNEVSRKDLIQLIIELKNNSKSADVSEEERKQWQKGVTLEELAAQVFIFFSAGFETSSTTLTFCLYELALNLHIQSKVRDEVTQILQKHNGHITYDCMMEMKYMNQVVEETLRKYPPVAFIGRRCERDYNIPNTDVVLEKGMFIDISILGIHHDPDYYPKPDKFDPERFTEENKRSRSSCTYLPFGEGPRMCIGLRFAIMEIKVALTVLLMQYEFCMNEKTKVPVEFEPNSFTLVPKDGIFLNVKKLKS